MTVPVQAIYSTYTGDGVTTSFNLACKVFLAADCQAYTFNPGVDTVPNLVTSGVTWTVAGDYSYATCVFTVAPPSGQKIGLIRRMDMTQNVSVSNTNYVPPSVMEQALDRQMMAIQEANLFATLPLQSDPFGFTQTARAGMSPVFDANGNQTYVLDPFPMMGVWSSTTSYSYRNVVTLNGEGFISRVANNLNNNPLTDNGTNWQPLSPATFTLRNGSGAPTGGLGNDGDFYIDTTGHAIYGPRSGGNWGSATSLIGPQGIPGVNGATIWNGSGAPSAGTGANGDFYIDTTGHAIYGPKASGAWGSGTNLVGPAGSMTGPGSSTVGHVASFGNTSGSTVADAPAIGIGGTSAMPSFDYYRAVTTTGQITQFTATTQNASGTSKVFAGIEAWNDVGTAGGEYAHWGFKTIYNGSYATRWYMGGGLYSPGATGGDQGADSINTVHYFLAGVPFGTTVTHNAMVAGDLFKKTAGAVLTADGVFADAALTSLTYAATITPDLSTGLNFTTTLTGNTTLANPANPQVGQSGVIYVVQDGTGSRTMAFGSNYKFSGGGAPVLSTGANKVDRLSYFVRSSTHIDIDISVDRR